MFFTNQPVQRILYQSLFHVRIIVLCFFFAATVVTGSSATCSELNWVYVETTEGIDLYKCNETFEGLIPFKAEAVLNIPHEKIIMILIDTERKSLWAPKLKGTLIHRQVAANEFEYSEYYSVPWPFFDREFFLHGTIRSEGDTTRFLANGSYDTHLPAHNHVLANVRTIEFKITPEKDSTSRVEFTFIGDMGGMVPIFVKNIIQKKWPVKFIQSLAQYASKHADFETERYRNFIINSK